MLMWAVSMAIFHVDTIFNLWMVTLVLVTSAGLVVLAISDLSDWSREKEGRYWTVAF